MATSYYVDYTAMGGKRERSEYYKTFNEAFDKYVEILSRWQNTGSCWAKAAYEETKIINCVR